MASTRTYAASKTWTRINLIKVQVRIALQRTGKVHEDALGSILKGIERKWLSEILVYGMDKEGRAHCQLGLTIEWGTHEIHIAAGRLKVSTDSKWKEDASIELSEMVKLFNDYVADKKLRVELRTQYGSGFSAAQREEFNKALGFSPGKPIIWAGQPESLASRIPELDELTVGIQLVT